MRVVAAGREPAVELVVGGHRPRGVTRRLAEPLIGGPQRGDPLRVERRRVPDGDALEHQQRRDELAQLRRIEEIGPPQMVGQRLDVRSARWTHAE